MEGFYFETEGFRFVITIVLQVKSVSTDEPLEVSTTGHSGKGARLGAFTLKLKDVL